AVPQGLRPGLEQDAGNWRCRRRRRGGADHRRRARGTNEVRRKLKSAVRISPPKGERKPGALAKVARARWLRRDPERASPVTQRLQEDSHLLWQELARGIHGVNRHRRRAPLRQKAHQRAVLDLRVAVGRRHETDSVSATDEEAERLKIPARGGADDTDARTMSVIHQLPP